MRILYIITGGDIGGAQKHVLYLAEWFQQRGHEVHVIVGEEGPFLKALQAKNISCHVISIPRTIQPFRDVKALWDLYWWIRNRSFDVVHCHSSKAGIVGRIAAYLNKVPKVIFTAHGFVFTDPTLTPWKRWFYLLLERLGERVSTDIITVSLFDYMKAKSYGLNEKKMHIIHNGVPNQYIVSQEEWMNRQEQLQRCEKKIIGFVGRFVSEKNIDMLIRIAEYCREQQLTHIEFWLIGDGELLPKYVELVHQKGLHHFVYFKGSQNNVLGWIDRMHILLITSYKEGLPYVLLEALGRGVPVVSTNVGGIKEVIGEDWVVPVDDDLSMLNKMIHLLMNEDERQRQGLRALQIVQGFSVHTMGEKTEKIYRDF
ncbi:glycosyltransferase involved in cell wall biosynthesis [Anoxybacillus tengchongensis]|uniref:Glycosyltransferase involved in cell wall biosynthesis n=1 Tax=Anoxybacillus tengchongensis TaxID=576944 RepID=A0A7X0D8U8_9BACL|nr:glycosyltransferase family 4 protein [Anoxybacillus tengchongensis]MBB6176072.1 glycosyltransferase involved in cell wall biosynthesis [Anoxybacillus tengchongensis]